MNRGVLALIGVTCVLGSILIATAFVSYQNGLAEDAAREAEIKATADLAAAHKIAAAELHRAHELGLSALTMYGKPVCETARVKYAGDGNTIMSYCQPELYDYLVKHNNTLAAIHKEEQKNEDEKKAADKQAAAIAHRYTQLYPLQQLFTMCLLALFDHLLHLWMAILIGGTTKSPVYQQPSLLLWIVLCAFAVCLPASTMLDSTKYLDWIRAPGCLNTFSLASIFNFDFLVAVAGNIVGGVASHYIGIGVDGPIWKKSLYSVVPSLTLLWKNNEIFQVPSCMSTLDVCVTCDLVVLVVVLSWAYSSYSAHTKRNLQAVSNNAHRQRQEAADSEPSVPAQREDTSSTLDVPAVIFDPSQDVVLWKEQQDVVPVSPKVWNLTHVSASVTGGQPADWLD
jgi:hypothetical protein